MSLSSEDRRWLGDLVASTVEATMRRHPMPQYKAGTVISDSTNDVRSVAVRLDDSGSIVYPDNIMGQPVVNGERVMVVLTNDVALIVGRWISPHIPHTFFTRTQPAGGRSTSSSGPVTWNGTETCSVTMPKYRDDTVIWCHVDGTWFHSATGYVGYLWVNIGGASGLAVNFFFNQSFVHHTFAGIAALGGVPAQPSLTCTVEWGTNSGAGGTLQVDTQDTMALTVVEIMMT